MGVSVDSVSIRSTTVVPAPEAEAAAAEYYRLVGVSGGAGHNRKTFLQECENDIVSYKLKLVVVYCVIFILLATAVGLAAYGVYLLVNNTQPEGASMIVGSAGSLWSMYQQPLKLVALSTRITQCLERTHRLKSLALYDVNSTPLLSSSQVQSKVEIMRKQLMECRSYMWDSYDSPTPWTYTV